MADLVLWQPTFLGFRPGVVIKGGAIVRGALGDPNASIPTPQPVLMRDALAAAIGAEVSATFVSPAALDTGLTERLGLRRRLLPIRIGHGRRPGLPGRAAAHGVRGGGGHRRRGPAREPRRRADRRPGRRRDRLGGPDPQPGAARERAHARARQCPAAAPALARGRRRPALASDPAGGPRADRRPVRTGRGEHRPSGTDLLVEDLDLAPAARRSPGVLGELRVLDTTLALGWRPVELPAGRRYDLDGPGAFVRHLGADTHSGTGPALAATSWRADLDLP